MPKKPKIVYVNLYENASIKSMVHTSKHEAERLLKLNNSKGRTIKFIEVMDNDS